MKQTIFLLSLFIASPFRIYGAQKQVHKLEQEQEAARKRQKIEGAEFASTSSPMDISYPAPISSEQTTTSSSCVLQEMEDIDEKLKSESQERSAAQKEFHDMFSHLGWSYGPHDLNKLEKLLQNPAILNLEEIIDSNKHQTTLLIVTGANNLRPDTLFKVMELLLNAKANVNARDAYGRTPLLHVALQLQTLSSRFINLLLEHGADITARDQEGQSVTDQIGLYDPMLSNKSINNDAITLLLDLLRAGAPLPLNKETKEMLFITAIEQNDAKVITRFIQEGNMDINGVYGDMHHTPLLHAAIYNNIPALKTLIRLGASINKQNEEGDMILHYLVARNPDIVKLLINAGANVNIQNSDGQTPLMKIINSVLAHPQDFTAKKTLPVIRALLRGNELYGGTDFSLHDTTPFQKPGGSEVQERSVEDYVEVYPLHDSPEVKKIKRAITKEILRYKLEQATYKRKAEQTVRETLTRHSGKDVGPIIQEYLHGNKGFAAITRTS